MAGGGLHDDRAAPHLCVQQALKTKIEGLQSRAKRFVAQASGLQHGLPDPPGRAPDRRQTPYHLPSRAVHASRTLKSRLRPNSCPFVGNIFFM